MSRIQGSLSYGREKVIREDLNRQKFTLRPVVGYWLRDAIMLDGSIYAGRYRHELRSLYLKKSRLGLKVNGDAGILDSASVVSTVAGSTWWGHWIADELPLQMLAEKFAPPLVFGRTKHYDEVYYRQLFNVDEPVVLDVARVRNLLLIDEFAQNPSKTKRYRIIREKLKNRFNSIHDKIYLRRGNTGNKRNLINESDVIRRLEREGFVVIDITQSTVEEVVTKCYGASVVVSIEGSHFTPLMYLMRDFGTMIVLNPPTRVLTTNPDIGTFCGLASGMFICEPAHSTDPNDFKANPDELCHFIDDALSHAKGNRGILERFLENVLMMDDTAHQFEACL